MTKNELITGLSERFPKCAGFAITGSQANNEQFGSISDIDVIVFDTYTSDVTSESIIFSKIFKIDCTIIPVLNIENVIINEFADTSGTVFNMISGCDIVYDPHLLLIEIKTIVINLQSTINNKVLRLSRTLIKKLLGFKKYFDRELEEPDRIILISEFITLVTKIAVIDKTGWEADRLRKATLLKQGNPLFLNEVINIYKTAMQSKDLGFINPFINQFQNSLKSSEGVDADSIVIDFAIPDFSMTEFCRMILPEILEDTILNSRYLYFYLSPKKYYHLYKYNVSVCFKFSPESSFFELLSEIAKKLPYKKDVITYEQVDILNKFKSDTTLSMIENLRKIVSYFWLSHYAYLDKDKELMESVCLSLSFYITQKLDFDLEDACYLNNYMLQKWLLHINEQRHVGGQQAIIKTSQFKIKKIEERYNQEKREVLNILKNNANIISISEKINVELYGQILQVIEKIIVAENLDWEIKFLPPSFFKFLQIKKKKEANIYLVLMEEIFQMLNISDDIKSRILYFSFRALSEEIYA